MVEDEDAETRAALAAMPIPGCFEVIVAPPGQPRTKPRALNVALPLSRGAFTAIYDAEDVPDPDQLRLAVAAFALSGPEVACLQARLAIDNTGDGWLARCFAIEYAALFDVVNPGLVACDLPVPLGGTSNHFRTQTLRDVLGWDAWNVTEDADIGVRLALAGHRVGDLPSTTLEEAPARLGAWMRQRTRWMKGFLQVCLTHSRRPWTTLKELGAVPALGLAATVGGTVLSALAYPFLTLYAVTRLATEGLGQAYTPAEALPAAIGLVLLVAGPVAIVAPAVVGLARRGWWDLLPHVLLLPAYYVLVSAAAWRALAELVSRPYHWHKTEHGLARNSRAGLVIDGGAAPRRPPRAGGSG